MFKRPVCFDAIIENVWIEVFGFSPRNHRHSDIAYSQQPIATHITHLCRLCCPDAVFRAV